MQSVNPTRSKTEWRHGEQADSMADSCGFQWPNEQVRSREHWSVVGGKKK